MNEEYDTERAVRVMVFIDGNNLYHSLKEKEWRTRTNIGLLAERLVGDRTLVHIYYYNAPPPGGKPYTKKGSEYLSQIKRTPKLTFRRAWLQPTKKTDKYGPYQSYIEKGGDTALTTDLVKSAAEDEFDVAIIVSNDSDYEPAVRTVRDVYGKSVEVVYFEGTKPFALESCALMRAFRPSYIIEHDFKRPSRQPHKKSHKQRRRR